MDETLQLSLKKWNALKHLNENQLKEIAHFHGFRVDKNDDSGGKSGALFLTTNDEMFAMGYNNKENVLALTGEDKEKPVELTRPRKIVELSGLMIKKMAVMKEFGAAITGAGELLYWGKDMRTIRFEERNLNYGSTPVHQPCDGFRAVDVSCGARSVNFITDKGEVVSWGRFGTSYTDFHDFKRIATRRNVRVEALSCGWYHVALLDQNGVVWMFGDGRYGQLGLGYEWMSSKQGTSTPSKVSLPGDCVKVECGAYSTLFLLKNQEIYACGNNSKSEHLCVAQTGNVITPAKVLLTPSISDIAAAYISTDGWQSLFGAYSKAEKKYYKWGDDQKLETPAISSDSNNFLDVFTNFKTPQTVADISRTNSVDLFESEERVSASSFRISLQRRFFERWEVFDVATDELLSQIKRFVVASFLWKSSSELEAYLAYAVTKDDDVYSWSSVKTRNLGQPLETVLTFAPAKMESLSKKNIKKIIVNLTYGIALSKDGSVYRWSDYETPEKFDQLGGIKDIATAFNTVVYLTEENTVWIDDKPKGLRQKRIPVHDQIVAVDCGFSHCAVLTRQSGVFTFGDGRHGQLGYEWDEREKGNAGKVKLPGVCKKITCGLYSTYFLLTNGKLYTCGDNIEADILPVGHFHQVVTPEKVLLDELIVDVAANKKYAPDSFPLTIVAVRTVEGKIYKWGGPYRLPTLVERITTLAEAFEDSVIPQTMSLARVATNDDTDYETDPEDEITMIEQINNNLFDDPLYSDVQIELVDSTITAHRFILHTKSSFFKNKMMSTKLTNRNQLDFSSYNPNAIKAILKYIYGVPVGRNANELKDLIDFHEIAKVDGGKELIYKSEGLLIENLLRIALMSELNILSDDDLLSRLFPGGTFP